MRDNNFVDGPEVLNKLISLLLVFLSYWQDRSVTGANAQCEKTSRYKYLNSRFDPFLCFCLQGMVGKFGIW